MRKVTRAYEVNADGNRSYTDSSAAKVADVATTWKKQGHRPQAFATIIGDQIECREVEISTKKATAKALVSA